MYKSCLKGDALIVWACRMSVCLGRCVRFKLQYVQCAKWAEHMLLHCNIMFGHLGHVDHTVREGGVGEEKWDHRGGSCKWPRWPWTRLGYSRAEGGGDQLTEQSLRLVTVVTLSDWWGDCFFSCHSSSIPTSVIDSLIDSFIHYVQIIPNHNNL